jgi:hypothetical protein
VRSTSICRLTADEESGGLAPPSKQGSRDGGPTGAPTPGLGTGVGDGTTGEVLAGRPPSFQARNGQAEHLMPIDIGPRADWPHNSVPRADWPPTVVAPGWVMFLMVILVLAGLCALYNNVLLTARDGDREIQLHLSDSLLRE